MIAGVFGGTFDPPHTGHLGLAQSALASGLVHEVWFAPCLRHRFDKAPAPFEHRLAMCRVLIAAEPLMRVTDIEQRLERPGYTLDLVLALQREHPEVTLRLLAGADIYHQRHLWHRYDEVARLAPPLFAGRHGVPPSPEQALPPPPNVSSTELRDKLLRGERPLELVPGPVLDYIALHGLYRESEDQ